MHPRRTELSQVVGVPETLLPGEVLDRLPHDAPPAPWDAHFSGVVWVSRGGWAARQALPPALRQFRAPVVGGAALRYTLTPVGAYDEVLGVVAFRDWLRPVGTVAFMAVDSEPSLVAGRLNWAMPKTLAASRGDAGLQHFTAADEGGDRWRVEVAARAFGPRVPVGGRMLVRQQVPGGGLADSTMRGRARVRPAVVRVAVDSDGPLPTWLRPGRHLGAVLESASFTLSEPHDTA